MMKPKTLLMVSESVHNSDMYYATRFLASDPFIFIRNPQGRSILIVSPMEYGRAIKESILDERDIHSTADYGGEGKKGNRPRREEIILEALRAEGIDEVVVPGYFPVYIADALRAEGISVEPVEELELTKKRAIKADWEVEYIKKAQRACEEAMKIAIEKIRNSRIEGDRLVVNGETLTSERVRAYIEHALIEHGCTCDSGEPIVACGKGAADPHFSGYGAILAHEPIIIDIFPRLKHGRYFADMTRTVSRGEPSAMVKEMYEAVKLAQESAEDMVKEGVRCCDVHNLVCDVFEDMGYETLRSRAHNRVEGEGEKEKVREEGRRGFIHFTGHGVGLDVHEPPSVGDDDYELRSGNVITIEPGLYEPGVGGVRLEDMVLVRKNGCENLTRYEKRLVI